MARITTKLFFLKLLSVVLLADALLAVVWSQFTYNGIVSAHRAKFPAQVFLPPATTVQEFSFGMHNFLADIFWIQSIQYLIIEGIAPHSLFMIRYLDIVTTLDSRFEYPYLFATIVLPRTGYLKEVSALDDKGIEAIPSSWQIPFYLAVQERVFHHDYDRALHYMQIAATRPNKPDYINTLIASYTLKSGNQVSAKELFEGIYRTSNDQYIKQSAKKWLDIINEFETLQSLIYGYQRVYGVYPHTLDDLVTKRLIRDIPPDVRNYSFLIDQNDGTLRAQ